MKIIDPIQNVDQIVEKLKQEAAQRKQRLTSFENTNGQHGFVQTDRTSDSNIPSLPLESSLDDRDLARYTLSDLLAYDDIEFLHNAYQTILKRPPDLPALENGITKLRTGGISKIDLIADLWFSNEGQEKHVNIPGLKWHPWVRRLCGVPLLGRVVKALYDYLIARSQQKGKLRRVGSVLVRQDVIARYLNEVLVETVRDIAARIEEALRLLAEQKETNEAVERLTKYLEDRINEEAFAKRQESRDRTKEIEDLRRVYNKYRTQVELTEKELKKEMEHLFRKQQEVTTQLIYQQDRLARIGNQHSANAPVQHQTKTSSVSDDLDAFFASFDEHFRGNREAVKDRLRAYLPVVRMYQAGTEDRPILDVACGRGEWLELLKEEKLHARGVDINSVLVKQCGELGLEVKQADLLAELRSTPDGSVGAISGFHIVEHLSLEELIMFLNESLRSLRSGGLVLLETPNPENVMVSSCNFYFDPTHRNPVPSPVLRFMLESRGFIVVETLALNPSDEKPLAGDSDVARRFNQYFYGPMDYAIVARKV